MIARVRIGRWMAVLLVLASPVSLTACQDDAAPAQQPRPSFSIDAAAAHDDLAALYAGDHPSARDRRDGACFAETFLRETTPFQLASSGVVDHQGRVVADLPALDAPTAEDWTDAQFACADFVEASTRALAEVKHGALREPAYADCLRDALSDRDLRDAVTASLMGRLDDPAVRALAAAQSDCSARATR
jgi:hypothetical protein